MRFTTLGGTAALLSLVALSAAAPGCGGGGGGGGTCSMPGTLAALALEGEPAPGTGPGVYGAFTATTPVSVADGGWTAFVVPVTGGSTAKGLFVARPDGSVSLAYAVGDFLPESSPGTGTITDFDRVFVTAGGVVVALVSGTTPAAGVLTARIDGTGAVVEKHGVAYLGDTLPNSFGGAIAGTLTAIDPDLIAVNDLGSVFFHGTGSGLSPIHGIYAADRLGANLTVAIATNDPLPGSGTGLCGTVFDGLGITTNADVVAFSVNVLAGTTTKGIYVRDASTALRVAGNGDTVPFTGGRTFEDVFAGGPLIVSLFSGVVAVAWKGNLSGPSPDLGVFIRVMAPTVQALETIAAPGQNAQGEPLGATYGDIALLKSENNPGRLTIQALITGGDTDQIFFSSPAAGTLNEIWREGTVPPGETGAFTNTYGSLANPDTDVTDDFGSPAFAATLSDATTGVFWAISSCGFFKVAKAGEPAPGTGAGVFGPFGSPTLVNTATNVVVFAATVSAGTALSGLFRQG